MAIAQGVINLVLANTTVLFGYQIVLFDIFKLRKL
jgi:hypothetical protein